MVAALGIGIGTGRDGWGRDRVRRDCLRWTEFEMREMRDGSGNGVGDHHRPHPERKSSTITPRADQTSNSNNNNNSSRKQQQ